MTCYFPSPPEVCPVLHMPLPQADAPSPCMIVKPQPPGLVPCVANSAISSIYWIARDFSSAFSAGEEGKLWYFLLVFPGDERGESWASRWGVQEKMGTVVISTLGSGLLSPKVTEVRHDVSHSWRTQPYKSYSVDMNISPLCWIALLSTW